MDPPKLLKNNITKKCLRLYNDFVIKIFNKFIGEVELKKNKKKKRTKRLIVEE